MPTAINALDNTNKRAVLDAAFGGIYNVDHYGAVGDGVTDDAVAIQSAIDAAIAVEGTVIFPPKPYAIASTITIANAEQLTIQMPNTGMIDTTLEDHPGLVWTGGNTDVMVLIQDIQRCNISLALNNRVNAATGITGIKWHNSDSSGSAQNHNRFPYISVAGCDLAMQWGDNTNDGYASNIDDNWFDFVYIYECKNGLLIDSLGQDNNIINRYHHGGNPSIVTRVREYNIRVLANGNGFRIIDGFMRGDQIIADNALIDIQSGSIRLDRMSFESSNTDVLPISLTGTTGRDMAVLDHITLSDDIRDSNNDCIVMNYRSGCTITNSHLTGNVTHDYPINASGNVFQDSYNFVQNATNSAIVSSRLGTRTGAGAAIDNLDATVFAHGFVNRPESVQTGNIFTNMEQAGFFPATLSANRTVNAPTNVIAARDTGRLIYYTFTADGSNRTLTFNAALKLSGGGTTHIVNANTTTAMVFIYDGTSWFEVGRSVDMA